MRNDAITNSAPTRAELVAHAVEQWSSDVSALGGRDPLLSYRDLKVGTLDLAAAESEARKALLAGERVLISKLFPYEPLRSSALRSVRAIRDKSRELAQERGLAVCYLAVGVASWANPFAARRPTAPVMLRSATVAARDPAETDFVITIADDPFVNPVLLHALDTQLGLRFDAADLRDPSGRLRYATVVERLREFAPPHVVDGFSVAHRAVLATFSTVPLALTDDIAAFGVDLPQHDVVAALAGDTTALTAIARPGALVMPEFRVLDTDAEQDSVVAAATGGGHLRVEAAPGTGRTQTVAALVAELVGRGQRVLVVGQKRATLDSLVERLACVGLRDVVLDTDRTVPADAVAQISDTARGLAAGPPPDDEAGAAGAAGSTAAVSGAELDAYRDALHRVRHPWGISAYDAMVHVATAPESCRTSAGVAPDVLAEAGSTDTVRARLREYADLGGLTLGRSTSPWFDADVHSVRDAAELMDTTTQLRERSLPGLRDAATRSAVEVGLAGPGTIDECLEIVDLLSSVAATVDELGPRIWDEPLDEFALATGDRPYRVANDGAIGFLARRKLRRRLAEVAGFAGRYDRHRVHERVLAAREQLTAWRGRSRDGKAPRTGPHLPDAVTAAGDIRRDLAALAAANPRTTDLPGLPIADAAKRLDELIGDEHQLRSLPRLYELGAELSAAGLDDLLAELRRRHTAPEHVGDVFDYAWYSSLLDHWRSSDAALGRFERERHEKRVAEFCAADLADQRASAKRVLRARHRRFAEIAGEYEGQAAVLTESAPEVLPGTPRELLEQAPDIALSAVPCWVSSPLTVPQSLPPRRLFDVVVVEDAGRLAVAESVPAVARADRVVLVGDDEVARAPFTTAVEPAPDPDEHEGPWAQGPPASVVDLVRDVLPERSLTGQYRVRDHRLVGFAASTTYAGRLVTVPGVGGQGRLSMDVVDAEPVADDPVDSSSAEVDRVVELILEHVRARPHESLGVVTLGPRHAERLDAALRRALIRAPEVAGYLRGDRSEPFFVKDVEHAGGDVRDTVILSLGYGRSVDGRILYRFGALGRPGGERRLTAATTCARERLTVVATFGADDLSPRRLTTAGAQALGRFLTYIQYGADHQVSAPDGDDEHDASPGIEVASGWNAGAEPFAGVVAERLREAGVGAPVVVGHGGPGGVGVAVRHPTRRDRFVLAVETDGPGFAARHSTRERERLRPAQLRRLGWNVHRAWSAAWANDPDGEARRLLAAYEQAVTDADAYDWAVAAAEADIVAGMPDDVGEAPGDHSIDGSAADASTGTTADGDGRVADGGDEAAGAGGEAVAGDVTAAASADAPSDEPQRSSARPLLVRGRVVSEYTGRELAALARWVESDGVARREDVVIDLMAADMELPFDDARTVDVLRHAVRVARAGSPAV